MKVIEHKPLATFTTFRIGGEARFFIDAYTEEDIRSAIIFAKEKDLPLLVIGKGSNILIQDEPIDAVIVRISIAEIRTRDTRDALHITAGAGVLWDDVVDTASAYGMYGVENLAGIPGSVGGAIVQNIGAYGTEISSVFVSADCIDRASGESETIYCKDAHFSYRTSFFKTHPEKIILRITLHLSRGTTARTEYPDLTVLKDAGASLASPREIAQAVRGIRAKKFPDISKEGTAGSFFKNPILPREQVEALQKQFTGLPSYPYEDKFKIPLAWILDRALGLKGYARGNVRLYEHQPLVLVTSTGANSDDVETLACDVEQRVFEKTGMSVEREVESFGTKK